MQDIEKNFEKFWNEKLDKEEKKELHEINSNIPFNYEK